MNKSRIALLVLTSILALPHAVSFEKGDLIVRVGLANVSSDESSSNIVVGGMIWG